jgi:hypothetical protein
LYRYRSGRYPPAWLPIDLKPDQYQTPKKNARPPQRMPGRTRQPPPTSAPAVDGPCGTSVKVDQDSVSSLIALP